ncbi:FAD-dependent monooxygenase [Flavicella sediminum]|uniref:FAD-dependent monooxygenase n=1 Tax=Flavicella sediminum TaxID=2585141 RepID=UPI00111CA42F|nr:FAD-dependent monooxygenase [Flavicella sediminum]
MTIDIIGAGIGGLTTAIALEQKGFTVRVFEQAEKIQAVGAGIILANNAMQVYQHLGLKTAIEKLGNPVSAMNITKANLSPLSNIDLSYFEKKYQVKNTAIHRGVLQQLLIRELKSTEIHLQHKLTGICKNTQGHTLQFDNGKEVQSEVLIAADGLHSKVRQELFPENEIRKAKQICWRGITDFRLPATYKNELNEAWGKTERFGFVQIAENKVYWYALKSFKKEAEELSLAQIENYFDAYHPIIKNLIESTNKQQIHTAKISDLKPSGNWYQQNVCLLGDAAHATTPNMGQGACQAIEDAYVLSECLQKYEVHKAFAEFQKLRIAKAHQVVSASWILGKMAHLSNPVLRALRNTMMRAMPSAMSRKQSAQIFELTKI